MVRASACHAESCEFESRRFRMEKICSRCKQKKKISEFYPEKSKKDGRCVYCKSCQLEISKEVGHRLREEAFEQYGGARCVNCGEDFFEVLSLDHIHGGGSKDRVKRGSGKRFLFSLKRDGWPKRFQVLCYNCNMIKCWHPELLKEYRKYRQKK